MIMKHFVIWGIVLCTLSFTMFSVYSYNKKQKLMQMVAVLQDETIEIPFDNMQMLSKMNSASYFQCDSCSEYKYILYYDSVSCTTCEMAKMAFWNKYIGFCKTNKVNISFVFIFSPLSKDIHDVKEKYFSQKYTFHVYLDTLNSFEQKNQYVRSYRDCRGIIIDSTKHIVYVGNPTMNKQEENRFYLFINQVMDSNKKNGSN